ncbi:MAG: hypothetical protein HYV40_01230 [Candidatus Levybacteria bacterium]|nr:hypothetical protein [Candidatus Levybacteria bacterium]
MKDAAHSKKTAESSSLSKGVFALIALVIVLVLVQFSLTRQGFVKGAQTKKEVQGESNKVEAAKERLQGTVEEQLNEIKKQVVSLDPEDVVHSSPQIQKIIDDLKNLQGVPKDELKNVCENICKQL